MTLVFCAGYLCAAAPPAQGQMFESAQQFWLNESRARAGLGWGAPYEREVYAPRRDREIYGPRDAAPYASAPQVEVKSPQYHNYQPDTLEALKIDQLCEVRMASTGTVTDTAPSFAAACTLLPSVSLRVLPEVGAALTAYYQKHSQFVWIDSGNVADKAKAVMAEMANAGAVGLIADNYRVELPKLETTEGQDALKEALRFELALSARALTYVLDATRGRVDPNRISGYHDLPRKKVDLVAALEEMALAESPAAYLAGRHPASAEFRALTAELVGLSRDAKPRVTLPPGLKIKPGQTHPALADVIAAIREAASPALKRKHADAFAEAGTGYSGELVRLVRAFQVESGLRPDGIVGPNTIGALKRDTAAAKIRKLQLAMERLRWLPHDLGDRYVFLNQPAYRVSIVDGGKEELSMPVIIGKTSNQTNFFADKIQAVEYNPSWTVPRSIIVNEMVPKLYRDPTYLDRAGYQVTNHRGLPVSSASVAWDRVALNKASVEVRQPPGPRNALGRLKIEFPNRHAIYMHDTPQKSLFKQSKRAFSHGCVRLEQPALMAAALLGKPVGHVNARIAAGKNAVEPVSRQIPVYLAYFTAWPDKDGKVAYFGDVYDRDSYLTRAIEKTNAVRTAAR